MAPFKVRIHKDAVLQSLNNYNRKASFMNQSHLSKGALTEADIRIAHRRYIASYRIVKTKEWKQFFINKSIAVFKKLMLLSLLIRYELCLFQKEDSRGEIMA